MRSVFSADGSLSSSRPEQQTLNPSPVLQAPRKPLGAFSLPRLLPPYRPRKQTHWRPVSGPANGMLRKPRKPRPVPAATSHQPPPHTLAARISDIECPTPLGHPVSDHPPPAEPVIPAYQLATAIAHRQIRNSESEIRLWGGIPLSWSGTVIFSHAPHFPA